MTASAEADRIGVIGLGAMGLPIAARLKLTGRLVGVCDANRDAAKEVAAELAVDALPSSALAAKVDVLVTVLPTSAIVGDVLFESGGAASALRSGALVLDMTSGVPASTREFASRLAAQGVAMVDAPVSGGVARARTGDLAIIAGGREVDIARVQPILTPVGASLFHVGDVGAGHAMKALNNLVSAGGLLIAAEAVNVARQFGIDPHKAVAALNASSGMNNATQRKFEQFILSETYDSGFGLKLMVKDLTTAVELAEQMGIGTRFAEQCLAIWRDAAEQLPADADHTRIAGEWTAPPTAL